MLKSLLSFVLVFGLLSSQAFAYNTSSLKAIFNDFQYDVTVLWDQKDPEFFNAAQAQMMSRIEAAGISDKEIIAYALSNVSDEQVKQALTHAYKTNNAEMMLDVINQSQAQGASWIGKVLMGLGIAVGVGFTVMGIMVLYALSKAPH